MLPLDSGIKPFTLTVNSLNFFASVESTIYNFKVMIDCAVTSLTITSKAAATTYTLNQGVLVTAAFALTQNAACN